MNSSVTRSFREQFARLPPEIRALARKQFALWLRDHSHPSLHFKKAGAWWAVRIDRNYRALGWEKEGTIHWFFIGSHAGYEHELS